MTAKTDPNGAADASHALVVGAGIGGIAAALRMRAKGYRVTLVERGDQLGGRARVFERNGFRFDAGPTVVTAPFLFEELFALFDRDLKDYLKLVPLTPWYRFQFPDGDTFDYGGTPEQTRAEIARFDERDVQGYEDLLAHSRKLFDAGFTELADQPFHNMTTMLKQAPRLLRLRADRTVWQLIAKHFRSPKLRQAFTIQPLLVGGSPFDTTSIYGLIHYLEYKWGVHFAMGGTGAIIAALGKLMDETGIEVRFNCTVDSLIVENGKVRGARLEDGETLSSDIVVSNVDPMHLYGKLVPKREQALSARLKHKHAKLSMGLFVLYFGARRQYPDVAHHTIWMGKRYKELLEDIFKRKVLCDDFSLYVHRPTATDPSFAPDGCDSFYALAPVPNLQGKVDWEVEGPKLRDRIVKALGETLLPGLEDCITSDFYMTPEDFSHDYLSHEGAGFSIAPYFTQSAWFRFHNLAEGVEGLYLTGAGTHPGAGMPGVLCSAKAVEKLVPAPVRNMSR